MTKNLRIDLRNHCTISRFGGETQWNNKIKIEENHRRNWEELGLPFTTSSPKHAYYSN